MTVTLEKISKRFSLKTVLDSVTAEFREGKIHALVGENGAGKSTLAALISGEKQPTSGVIKLDGEPVLFENRREAAQRGILLVHQRPLLARSITVKENILLGTASSARSRNYIKRLSDLRDHWAPGLNLNAIVQNIGADARFQTALLSALFRTPAVLILDEPSASLDWEQRRLLYADIRMLAETGTAVIVITHSMEEAALFTDTVTVLSRGTVAAHYADSKSFKPGTEGYKDFTIKTAGAIPGRSSFTDGNTYLSFRNITVRPQNRPALFDISFTAFSGGITLIKGLQEAGLGTLENVITGMETARAGGLVTLASGKTKFSINLHKQHLTTALLRGKHSLQAGIVPTDRTFRGANPDLSVGMIVTTYYTGRHPEQYARYLIDKAGIKITPSESAANLSGGMLQRLILARELDRKPPFIIMCEPLQGLDTASSGDLCTLLAAAARQGSAVIVLSATPFPEKTCSSVYKLEGGRIKTGENRCYTKPPDGI
ncbi:MAG: ATP-binding cassette domain-containing protein [Treponema sp.]|jgi:ABC-type uncharacterized transport system ATPase subunit|nr:ATP-binding cassette domain-containing protein [Treponema sp.]